MQRLIPTTISGRLAGTFTLLFVAVMAPVAFWLVNSAEHVETDQSEFRIEQLAIVVTTIVSEPLGAGDTGTAQQELDRIGALFDEEIYIVDRDGTLLASTTPDSEAADRLTRVLDRVPQGDLEAGQARSSTTTGGQVTTIAPVGATPGFYVVIESELGVANSQTTALWRQAVAGVALASLIVAALSLLVARRISSPLAEIRQQALAMSSGDLDVFVDPAPVSELGDLARAFNYMTGRIRQLLAESADARNRLEAIFENLSDGVLVIGEDRQIVAANARAHELLLLPAGDVAGVQFVVAVRDHELINLLNKAMAARRTQSEPIAYSRSGRQLEATAIPILYGRERLGIIVVRDVTELRRLEQVRREFVANVSHELRTPLASIRALVETLEAGAIDDPEVSGDFLHRIVGETDRLTALVEELLDLARLESGRVQLRRESIAPEELLTTGVDRLRPQVDRAGLQMTIEVAIEMPNVLVDRARIEQVLLNLIHNAIKFTPAGGSISVIAVPEGAMLRIDVADTGAGIPEDELPRLFERFFKADRARRSEGTGLGLAIAKHIVLSHGGEVHVSSEVGVGSVFSFTVPFDQDFRDHGEGITLAPTVTAGQSQNGSAAVAPVRRS
jgi:two-component system, OmpR family, phosphate regulon sensor histidine kinase PhoR